MGKIYSPPKDVEPVPGWADFEVDGKFDMKKMEEVEKEWTEKLRDWCKANSPGRKYVGEIIRQHVADGYAQYMVFSLRPLVLLHLELGDAYQFQWDHRWTVSDVKGMVEYGKRMDSLFGQA